MINVQYRDHLIDIIETNLYISRRIYIYSESTFFEKVKKIIKLS